MDRSAGYRPWRKAQAFLIESGWIGLAAGALPIPLAVLSARLQILAALGPLGSLLFFGGFVLGLVALPLALTWALCAGSALVVGALRAKAHAEPGEILEFKESGLYSLLHGAGLIGGGLVTALAVVLLTLSG